MLSRNAHAIDGASFIRRSVRVQSNTNSEVGRNEAIYSTVEDRRQVVLQGAAWPELLPTLHVFSSRKLSHWARVKYFRNKAGFPNTLECISGTWQEAPLRTFPWHRVTAGHDGNTARLSRRSDEALGVRVRVARIAPSLLDLGRAVGGDECRGIINTRWQMHPLGYQTLASAGVPDQIVSTALPQQNLLHIHKTLVDVPRLQDMQPPMLSHGNGWPSTNVARRVESPRSGLNPQPGHSGFSHVGIVPDDAVNRRVFSGISRFSRACILAPLHTRLAPPLSALKTSMLRAVHISSLTHFTLIIRSFRDIHSYGLFTVKTREIRSRLAPRLVKTFIELEICITDGLLTTANAKNGGDEVDNFPHQTRKTGPYTSALHLTSIDN
ncbi:hypothetical protein PR048_011665 [Dryococelus australis]|uniref:Uncharacterized protein n=1 Tax=Dryococelus australis TaxID=614101 RepID=A0ABQ9HM82_9NEOP|nr:hypothetical protein PR048_011665 [Dryococelus australis]